MSEPFRFKQFSVNQDGCAMKINTDGVLLGALASHHSPNSILDIGTGTGVISLMLAQRYPLAEVEAVEVDKQAALTADHNFKSSSFRDRLALSPLSFQEYSQCYPDRKFDLIASNPPFFLHSLKNPDHQKHLARHSDTRFFDELIQFARVHLNPEGVMCLVLPPETASYLIGVASQASLAVQKMLELRSFSSSQPHRLIISLGFKEVEHTTDTFVIYAGERQFSQQYIAVLKNFFIIF